MARGALGTWHLAGGAHCARWAVFLGLGADGQKKEEQGGGE